MKKLKIYLDTSVISHLEAFDTPDKMADTVKLWEDIKNGQYEVSISDVTLAELDACPDEKRGKLLGHLSVIDYNVINVDEQILRVAEKFVSLGILRSKSLDDCQHIASAMVFGCDVIVSWNFKHIVNHKTMQGVKAISALEGFGDVLIYSPSMLIGGDWDDTPNS